MLIKIDNFQTEADGAFTMIVLAEVDVQNKQTTGRYIVIKLSKSKDDFRPSKLEIIEEAHSENKQSSEIEKASIIHNEPKPLQSGELSLFSSLMEPSQDVDSGHKE